MMNFLKKNTTTTKKANIDEVINNIAAILKKRVENHEISEEELIKIQDLATDLNRLRKAIKWL